jgi:hypothetical protein
MPSLGDGQGNVTRSLIARFVQHVAGFGASFDRRKTIAQTGEAVGNCRVLLQHCGHDACACSEHDLKAR